MKKILLVEDDQLLSSILAENLRNALYEVDCVYGGNEAIESLAQHPYDLVLLDILLPGKDGFDVIAAIRSAEATKQIPVIVVSNLADDTSLDRMTEAGATSYIIKSSMTPDGIIREVGKLAP